MIIQHKCKIADGKIIPYDIFMFRQDLTLLNEKDTLITIDKYTKTRSKKQNRALHLYLTLLSTELNLKGFDMKKIIKTDISWTPYSAKENLWKPIQKAMFGKKSTVQLNTFEINEIYDNLNRTIIELTTGEVQIPFPCLDELFKE